MARSSIAFASTFTCEPVGRWVDFWLEHLSLEADLQFAGFGQLERELRSPLTFRGASCCIGLVRLSDWYRGETFDAARFESALEIFFDSVRAALTQLPRLCIVVCPTRPCAHMAHLDDATARLVALGAAEARVCVVDACEAIDWYATSDVHDAVADELGHVPYAEPMWCTLGGLCTRLCLPALAPALARPGDEHRVLRCGRGRLRLRDPPLRGISVLIYPSGAGSGGLGVVGR